MSVNLTALLVAVAGVLGTLTSPILIQRLTLRAKQQEIDALKQQRSEERAEEQRRMAFKEGRDCCIALNTAAILSDTVMDAALPVWDRLATAYGRVRAIGTHLALPDRQTERDRAMSYLDEEVDNAIHELRRTMRSDLGITEPNK